MSYISGLVSVVIPTFRRSDMLVRAVDSVLNQTYSNIECIVVNDNEKGNQFSLELYERIKKYSNEKRFRFIEQERHINGAEARNCGIRAAQGEYVAFLDDDDWWKNNKIEKQVDFIKQQNDECGGVSTLVEFYNGEKIARKSLLYEGGKIYKKILRRQVGVTTCSLLLKHTCLDDAGYFDISLRRHQEIQLLSFFTLKYSLEVLPEHLTCVNLDTTDNRPDSNKLIQIKKDFFVSVSPVMATLSKMEQGRIRALHMFELALVELREKKYWNSFKHMISVCRDPITFGLAFERSFKRIVGKIRGKKYKN